MARLVDRLPAISHELAFVAKYSDEVEAIVSRSFVVDDVVQQLTDAVSEKADADVKNLLDQLGTELAIETKGILRFGIAHRSTGNWEIWAEIYPPKGVKRSLAFVGLCITVGADEFRLVGWFYPPGGLDERVTIAHACRKKIEWVHFSGEQKNRYRSWPIGSHSVIWLDRKLGTKVSLVELKREIHNRARPFFKLVLSLL